MLALHFDQNMYMTADGVKINSVPPYIFSVKENYDGDGDAFRILDQKGHSRYYCLGDAQTAITETTRPSDMLDPSWMVLLAGMSLHQDEFQTDPDLYISFPLPYMNQQFTIKEELQRLDWEVYGISGKFTGKEFRLRPRKLCMYPAISAAVYDMMIRDRLTDSDILEDTEQHARYEELKDSKQSMLLFHIGNKHTEWMIFTTDPFIPVKTGVFSYGISSILLDIKSFYQNRVHQAMHPIESEIALANKIIRYNGRETSIENIIHEGASKLARRLHDDMKEIMEREGTSHSFMCGEGMSFIQDNMVKLNEKIHILRHPEKSVVRGLWKTAYLDQLIVR